MNETILIFPLQVWFQNRRMKDKRQRIAVAWPYAAVYADPTFAASLLQAAANSVAMPYGYGPNPMIPQMPMIGSSQLTATATADHYSYAYRYAPYSIPQRNPVNIPASGHVTQLTGPLPVSPVGLSNTHPAFLAMPSPTSPLSSISLSPTGSDPDHHHHHQLHNNNHSNIRNHQTSNHMHSDNKNEQITTLIKTEKPKLFKPYKSEQ